jgi:dTDP-4-dehydrorhamnose reductase
MNRAYVTGLTGTVAPWLVKALQAQGIKVVGHHVRVDQPSDIARSLADVENHHPDAIFHLALGPVAWSRALAEYAFLHHVKFVYISTASVFEDNAGGPYTVDTPVLAKGGYPLYKYQCEQAIKEVNPHAYILRIGWQIDPNQRSDTNNMFRFFHDQIKTLGKIKVSDHFYPSASFLPDTVLAIIQASTMPYGTYHLNGNEHSLYAIAQALKQRYATHWIVEKDPSFSRNDVLQDDRIVLPKVVT